MVYQQNDELLLSYMSLIQAAIGEGFITEPDLIKAGSPIAMLLLKVIPAKADLLDEQDFSKMWHLGKNLTNLQSTRWEVSLISQLLSMFDPTQMPFQTFVDTVIVPSLQDPISTEPCQTPPVEWERIKLPNSESPFQGFVPITGKVVAASASTADLTQEVILLFLGSPTRIIGKALLGDLPNVESFAEVTVGRFVLKYHPLLSIVLVGKCT